MNTARIILVDDHNVVRRGLAALLETDERFHVVGEAGNGEEALALVESETADLIVMDLSMPRMNGFEAIRRVVKKCPRIRIVVLSMYDDPQFVAEALRDGARGYILKEALENEFFQAIEAVLAGGQYVSSAIEMERVQEHLFTSPELTAREREVLQLIADGHTTQGLADILQISPHTATRHRANLMQKLNAHNQVELVRAAAQKGIIILK
jgi:two-component system, NarL family, response regulator NreC